MSKKKPKPASRKKTPAPQAMSLTAMHPAGMIFTLTITRKPGNEAQIDLVIDAHPGVPSAIVKAHLDHWQAWAQKGFLGDGIDDPIPDGWSWIHEHLAAPPSSPDRSSAMH